MKPDPESRLLGALMLGRSMEPAAFLRPNDFATVAHGAIWQAGWDVLDAGARLELTSLERALRSRESFGLVGGLEGLVRYADLYPHAPISDREVEELAREIRRQADIRNLRRVAGELVDACKAEAADPTELSAEFARRLDLVPRGQGEQWIPMASLMRDVIDGLRRRETGAEKVERIPTGLRVLDEYLRGGLRPGWLVGLAGVAKMGKSAAMGLMLRASARAGHPTLVFSSEMTGTELAERDLSARSEIPIEDLEGPQPPLDWSPLIQAANVAQRERYDVVDDPGSWRELVTTIRRWRRQNPDRLGLIAIDYLQLIKIAQQKGESREQCLGKVTREAKAIAKETGCCVLLLAQLNDYKIAQREDKRPRMSDIRESGSLNKDANLLLAVHRPWVYDTSKPPQLAEIHVLANRHGSFPRILKAVFVPRLTTFGDDNP